MRTSAKDPQGDRHTIVRVIEEISTGLTERQRHALLGLYAEQILAQACPTEEEKTDAIARAYAATLLLIVEEMSSGRLSLVWREPKP